MINIFSKVTNTEIMEKSLPPNQMSCPETFLLILHETAFLFNNFKLRFSSNSDWHFHDLVILKHLQYFILFVIATKCAPRSIL